MCGIAGWLTRSGKSPGHEVLNAMLDAIAHRGPDDAGTHITHTADHNREIALGHRRLAIIDPVGGHQPMLDGLAGLALTFNGEIYNFREIRADLIKAGYKFALDSDTEVLLRAYQHWGCEMLGHLRGMFAFALWDARLQRLFVARDRFGEKPLFICEDSDGIYFASEIKALLKLPGFNVGVDLQAVWDYLSYRYVPGPRTLFKGVRKLQPGSYGIWEKGAFTESRYYAPPDRLALVPMLQTADITGSFLAKLDETVKAEMVSDVPFGAFLSGGLDSSAIVALMCKHSSRPIMTYSVGFSESAYSELSHAAEIARLFNTDHHELVVSHRHVIENLSALVRFRDAPISEASDVPIFLLAKEASRTVKMVLTGEGSDEILGGYPKHVAESYVPGYQMLPAPFRHYLIEPLIHALPYRFRRIKTAVANLGLEDREERYVRWFGALSNAERGRLSHLRLNGEPHYRQAQFDSAPENTMLRRILYFDQTSWLPDNLLERGDRMSMAASIEARVPFLDHELAAFVSALPDCYRVRGRQTKWVLREAMKQLLPEGILNRPKVGFRVPINEWLRSSMRDFLIDHLQSSNSMTRDYFDQRELNRIVDEHMTCKQNHEKLLWSLLNLEIWHRLYV